MTQYANLSGNSGVAAYLIDSDCVTVKFTKGGVYRYTYLSAGRENVEQLKRLAVAGRGLSTYIAKYLRNCYVK